MKHRIFARQLAAIFLGLLLMAGSDTLPALGQNQAAAPMAAAPGVTAPEPLSEAELEILVARIALYPDELIAVISAASLYPLQIVEASRFLDAYEKDKSLKPKDSWDGSVISLLNYPEIVRMMSNDLDWTQALASAIAYQQEDVLVAIQQLRDEAVAKGILKSDDKVTVSTEEDNVVIVPATPEKIYIPVYEPQMLYVPSYAPVPIRFYPHYYPPYYYPTATFFAGVVTGVIWAAAVDWNRWGVWGGPWRGNDVNINCNNCFNNRTFNGEININDVDWRNVDRSKIKIDRDQLTKIDQTNIRNNLEANRGDSIGNKAARIERGRPSTLPVNVGGSRDIRKSTLEGLKSRPGARPATRPAAGQRPATKPSVTRPSTRPSAQRPARANRPASRPKPAARRDTRPARPSGLGNVGAGKPQKVQSKRGAQSRGSTAARASGGGRRR